MYRYTSSYLYSYSYKTVLLLYILSINLLSRGGRVGGYRRKMFASFSVSKFIMPLIRYTVWNRLPSSNDVRAYTRIMCTRVPRPPRLFLTDNTIKKGLSVYCIYLDIHIIVKSRRRPWTSVLRHQSRITHAVYKWWMKQVFSASLYRSRLFHRCWINLATDV